MATLNINASAIFHSPQPPSKWAVSKSVRTRLETALRAPTATATMHEVPFSNLVIRTLTKTNHLVKVRI